MNQPNVTLLGSLYKFGFSYIVSLFRKKRKMPDEMTYKNASKNMANFDEFYKGISSSIKHQKI